jgi:hypothetical protein
MPRQKKAFADLGSVQTRGLVHRAHVQYRNENNVKSDIYGPDRSDEARAEVDLSHMRAAAAVGKTREKGFEIMEAEAQRIKITAEYEAEIRATTLPQMDSQEVREPDEPDYGSDVDPEEPWLAVFDCAPPKEIPQEETPASQRPCYTPLQATKVLVETLRPISMLPGDLKHLLESRADPNAPFPAGSITPLQNVLTFAREKDVEAMRELLLKHGAHESEKDRKQWATRQKADFNEQVRLSEYYDDPCGCNPWDATLLMDM